MKLKKLRNHLIRIYWQYRRELNSPNYHTYKYTLVKIFSAIGLFVIICDFILRFITIWITSSPIFGEPIPYNIILIILCTAVLVSPRKYNWDIFATHVFLFIPIVYALRSGIAEPSPYSAALILGLSIFLSGFLLRPFAPFLYGVLSFITIFIITKGDYGTSHYESVLFMLLITVLISFILARAISYVFAENEAKTNKMMELYENDKKLFNSLAHRLKTPLTILQTEIKLQMLKEQPFKEQQVQRLIKEINDTINELTKVSKVNLSQFTTIKSQFSLFELINTVKTDSEILAKNYLELHGLNRTIRLDCPSYMEDANIYGSFPQLREALLNIIDNSISHNERRDNMRITITIYEHFGDYAISIADNGQGIEPSKLKDILSQRTSAPSSTTHSSIGLAIVRNIIRNHRGKLNIYSQPDVGTAVEIILPPR